MDIFWRLKWRESPKKMLILTESRLLLLVPFKFVSTLLVFRGVYMWYPIIHLRSLLLGGLIHA